MRKTSHIVIGALLFATVIVAALFIGRSEGVLSARASNVNTASNASANTKEVQSPDAGRIPILSDALESATPNGQASRSWVESSLGIVLRLLLAVILASVLAFRPKKNFPLFKRNLYVSQTQILLAVVAAALMMIVGDNAARAFAIFAAVSLVRFRTNIRDPKEVTVLLISLALGLAAGVGRWELGIALCLFSLVLLWFLEYNEQDEAIRSMEITVETKDTDRTQQLLKAIFRKNKLDAEIRKIDPPTEPDDVGKITYYLNLRLNVSTDQLSDKLLAADKANIEGIKWSKTKNATDIYQ